MRELRPSRESEEDCDGIVDSETVVGSVVDRNCVGSGACIDSLCDFFELVNLKGDLGVFGDLGLSGDLSNS